jgi:hypothetical protein
MLRDEFIVKPPLTQEHSNQRASVGIARSCARRGDLAHSAVRCAVASAEIAEVEISW